MTMRQKYRQRNMMKSGYLLWFLIFSCLIGITSIMPVSAKSMSYQTQEPLRQLAQEYLQQSLAGTHRDTEITIGRLDSRLRLAACGDQLKAFMPPGSRLSGKLTVGVRCANPKPWTLYIPAEIRIFANIMAAASPLSRGTVISKDDLISTRQEVSRLHMGYFSEPAHVIGKVLKHSMNTGDAFSPRRLQAPLLVRHGDEVTIIASVGNIQVRSKGKALKNAAKGEKLTVRNTRSKRVIEAVAIRPGTVSINM